MTRGYLSDDQGDEETTAVAFERRVRETAKAVLFEIRGESKWIPKSMIRDEDQNEIQIPEWFAEKEGLI